MANGTTCKVIVKGKPKFVGWDPDKARAMDAAKFMLSYERKHDSKAFLICAPGKDVSFGLRGATGRKRKRK